MLGEWLEKQIVQLRNSRMPRRRMRQKTRPPQRMPPERAKQMQDFLHADGSWLAPAIHGRLRPASATLAPTTFEPPDHTLERSLHEPLSHTRQPAQEAATRERTAHEPLDPRPPARETSSPTVESARPARASHALAPATAPTALADAALQQPMGMLRSSAPAPALQTAAQPAPPIASRPRSARPHCCDFCGSTHSSSSCMLNPLTE